MRRRPLLLVLAVLVPAVLLAGCGDQDDNDADEVKDALHRTAAQARRMVFEEETPGRTVTVEAAVEDDFRYRAQVSLGGTAVYDEVVSDDTLAARALTGAAISLYADDELGDVDQEKAGLAVQALKARHWVVDPVGAPTLFPRSEDDRDMGDDPVFDALTTMRYVENVVLRENWITEYNESDLEYNPDEDPFPTPDEGSDVLRYDVRPPSLPKARDAAGNQAVPGPQHFRKMAVYVRDGVVIRILEIFDVAGRLDEIEENYDIDFPEGATAEDKVRISVDAINAVIRGQGSDPIRVRSMSLDVTDVGRRVEVALPEENVVEGSLAVLAHRGTDDLRPS